MAPGNDTSLEAGNNRLADGQDLKKGLLEQGAKVIEQQIEKQNALKALTAQVNESKMDPAQNPDCIRMQKELDALQAQYNALEATWMADFPGAKRMFSLRLNGGQYKNYLGDQKQEQAPTKAETPAAARAEVLATTHVAVLDFQKEVASYVEGKDRNHIALTAQALVEAKLMPSDLVDEPYAAIDVVFGSNPALARSLSETMTGPDSPQRAALTVSLNRIRDSLTEAYQTLRNNKEMVRTIEQGTVQGTLAYKLKTAAGEIGRDPLALTAFVGGLVGLGYLFWTSKKETKESIGKWLGGGAAVIGGVYLGDFVWGKMDAQHRGLFDRIGMDPGNLVAPELVSKVKEQLAGYPQTDQDSIMDMARIFDMKMPDVNDAFEKALTSGSRKIDPLTLQARGVKIADGGSLFNALGYFYGTQCYKEAIKDPSVAKSSKPDEQMKIGLHYSQRHLSADKLATAVYSFSPDHQGIAAANQREAAAGVSGAPVVTGVEGIKDAPLEQLASKHPALEAALVKGKDNTILIKGYPYTHRFVDGKDIFTPVLKAADGSALPEIALKVDDSDSLFNQLVANSETAAKTAIEAKIASDPDYATWKAAHTDGSINYKNDGTWVLDPGLALGTHVGLPAFGNVTVPLSYKFEKGHLALHMTSASSKPEYADLKTAREDYEKASPIHDEVAAKVAYALLGVDFIVKDVVDNAATKESTVTIQYKNDGHTGTVTYKEGALASINLKSGADIDLKTAWAKQATVDVQKLMETPMVTAQLGRMAEKLAARPDGVWGNAQNALNDLKTYFSDLTKSEPEGRFTDAFVADVKNLQLKAIESLATNLYGADKTPSDFAAAQSKFNTDFPNAIRGKVEKDLGNTPDTVAAAALTSITTFDSNLTAPLAATEMQLSPDELAAELPKYNAALDARWKSALGLRWYSVDSTRRAVLQPKITEEVNAMDTEILGLSPADATRAKIKVILEKYQKKTLSAAGTNYGVDSKTAVDKLIMERLDPSTRKLWEGPTKIVEDYVLYKMKWENYAIFSKPENAQKVMDLWFKQIKNGSITFNGAATSNQLAEDYANYFLSKINIHLGGHQDYSLDSLYGNPDSVSVTAFDTSFAGIEHDMDDLSTWSNNGHKKLPLPDALKSSSEVYIEQVKAQFDQWFKEKADVGALLKIDGAWPQQFEDEIMAQFQAIHSNPNYQDPLILDQKIDEFKQMTLMLRYQVFEIYINNRAEDNKAIVLSDHFGLFKPMSDYVKNDDLAGYQSVVKKFMTIWYINHQRANLGIPFI